MNKTLMEHIAYHILSGFGATSSLYIDGSIYRSLISKEFLLDQEILFKNEEGEIVNNPIYGCQFSLSQKEFKILLGDCSQDKKVPEYCLIVHLTDNPAYGLYMVCDPSVDSEALIAVSVNDKDWMPCNTFLQATFLAAMEQLKDVAVGCAKCNNYQRHYEMLLSMINFHTIYCEAEDEGQEVGS
jgi:hypothetical protein